MSLLDPTIGAAVLGQSGALRAKKPLQPAWRLQKSYGRGSQWEVVGLNQPAQRWMQPLRSPGEIASMAKRAALLHHHPPIPSLFAVTHYCRCKATQQLHPPPQCWGRQRFAHAQSHSEALAKHLPCTGHRSKCCS